MNHIRIPIYERRVRSRAAPVNAAGAAVDRGRPGMGEAAAALAPGLTGMAEAELKRRAELEDLDIMTAAQEARIEVWDFNDAYMERNRGRDAVDAEQAAVERYGRILAEKLARFDGDGRAQNFLRLSLNDMFLSGRRAMRDYGGKQQDIYRAAALDAQRAIARRTWMDPGSSAQEREDAFRLWSFMADRENARAGLPPKRARLERDELRRRMDAEKTQRDRQAYIFGEYAGRSDQIRGLPPDRQDAVFASGLASIEDAEVRDRLRVMRENDRELMDKKQASLDASLVEAFEDRVEAEEAPYSARLAMAARLKDEGLSARAYDSLLSRIGKGLNTSGRENQAATDALFMMIDEAVLNGLDFGAEDIARYALAHDLTPRQKREARAYFGGMSGARSEGSLWRSRTAAGAVYASCTGKDLGDDPQFFAMLRKAMEGKPATEEDLRKTVSGLLRIGMGGENQKERP